MKQYALNLEEYNETLSYEDKMRLLEYKKLVRKRREKLRLRKVDMLRKQICLFILLHLCLVLMSSAYSLQKMRELKMPKHALHSFAQFIHDQGVKNDGKSTVSIFVLFIS